MKTFKRVMTVIIAVLGALILYHTLNHYYPKNIIQKTVNGFMLVLTPVLIAVILVYLVNPFTNMLIKKNRMNKKAAILTTIILLVIVIASIGTFVGFFFINQGREVLTSILKPEFTENVRIWFDKYNLSSLFNYIEEFVKTFDFEELLGPATSLLGTVIQGLTAIILVPIFLWHLLSYKENIYKTLDSNIPETWKNHVIPITVQSNDVLASYFRSKILSMIMLFFMFIVVYAGLGLPIGYVILFAILISMLDIIPYLGPTAALLVPIIYIFSTNGVNILYVNNWHINAILANVILIGLNFLVQLIQGNYIVPKLAGKEMDINPALILVFMLFFGSILGVWGIILSIPLGGIIIVIWNHIKEQGFLKDKKKSKSE